MQCAERLLVARTHSQKNTFKSAFKPCKLYISFLHVLLLFSFRHLRAVLVRDERVRSKLKIIHHQRPSSLHRVLIALARHRDIANARNFRDVPHRR